MDWVFCSQVEVKLEGDGPWTLPDGSQDMEIVLTPGHTEYHCCLVYKPKKVIYVILKATSSACSHFDLNGDNKFCEAEQMS